MRAVALLSILSWVMVLRRRGEFLLLRKLDTTVASCRVRESPNIHTESAPDGVPPGAGAAVVSSVAYVDDGVDGGPAGIEAMVVLLLFADDVLPENTAREIAKMNCSLKSNVFFIKTP